MYRDTYIHASSFDHFRSYGFPWDATSSSHFVPSLMEKYNEQFTAYLASHHHTSDHHRTHDHHDQDYYDDDATPSKQHNSGPYTLKVDAQFEYADTNDLVYWRLSDNQKLVIVEHILQVRPYTSRNLRKRLDGCLTVPLAHDLLSTDTSRIDAAIQDLFPINDQESRSWMTGLSKEERIQVIDSLADATLQSSEDLRDLFLAKNIAPSVAREILNASSKEDLVSIARKYGLFLRLNPRDRPWQKGANQLQKKAIVQRMMNSGIVDPLVCYDFLKKRKVPEGYGLKMLKVNDETFVKIMDALGGRGPLPALPEQ
ncbi:hypothetical protein CBS101457_000081 [Exobasidium rhododendri]|nr:hypothetical protein CBS101457_000081 [Exobasidium rhododendri]